MEIETENFNCSKIEWDFIHLDMLHVFSIKIVYEFDIKWVSQRERRLLDWDEEKRIIIELESEREKLEKT